MADREVGQEGRDGEGWRRAQLGEARGAPLAPGGSECRRGGGEAGGGGCAGAEAGLHAADDGGAGAGQGAARRADDADRVDLADAASARRRARGTNPRAVPARRGRLLRVLAQLPRARARRGALPQRQRAARLPLRRLHRVHGRVGQRGARWPDAKVQGRGRALRDAHLRRRASLHGAPAADRRRRRAVHRAGARVPRGPGDGGGGWRRPPARVALRLDRGGGGGAREARGARPAAAAAWRWR
mmetsp:Transcript_44695/g.137736  ORF Transcript_44695/g.137736 Transcript_44695/m.137736 type:complete len:243 (+) Transcript_44695:364-1092(+)